MKFKYKIITREGKTFEGETEAKDKFELARHLKEEGKSVLYAEEVREKIHPLVLFLSELVERVSLHDKIVFMRNLSAMLEAGLPLVRALGVLTKQTKNKRFQTILKSISEKINKGDAFSRALENYPTVFSSLASSMVRAGEESGKLPESLSNIGEHLERTFLLRRRIRGALMYPSIVVFAMFLIGILMFVYIVPTLTGVFEELNVELPTSTKSIIFISTLLKDHFLITIFGLGVVAFFFAMFTRSVRGKRIIETVFLHFPVIGDLIKQINSARTARTLSSLLSSGVKMVEALFITHEVVQNTHYKSILKDAGERVQKGATLSTVFTEHENLYPILMGEMVAVGEETGQLSEMLMRVALFYEGEVEQRTKDMSTIVEPILMVIVGIAVGFFAVSMITPLYSVLEGI